jgi:putative intracellular protease/amidase
MKRREFLITGATATLIASTNVLSIRRASASDAANVENLVSVANISTANKLTPPADGPIPVAFAISRGATMIDFAGPWEVFQDVMVRAAKAVGDQRDGGRDKSQGQGDNSQGGNSQDGSQGGNSQGNNRHADHRSGFTLYTVSEKTDPIEASAGMKIIPDYTFETAPAPKVVVIPAQAGSPALHAWLRKIVDSTDVTMSVCTGAFQLGRAGLLSGKEATTHHDFFDQFAKAFPDVKLKRGQRFVENEKISTAGGLTSGIDLALRVVERYFGRETAEQTAFYMEYQSKGWIV